jgi:dTMP kinase
MEKKFIVFEGTDGSGKSTMLEEVRKHLASRGVTAEFVCDPGGTAIGGQIRQILLAAKNANMSTLTELLLYSASRAQLVTEKILPALNAGQSVISDRFIYSTLAYQGVAGEIPANLLKTVVQAGCSGLEPDHVIFLDVPAEIGLKRAGKGGDRVESKGVCYMDEVRQRYLGLLDTFSEEKATVIDANRNILEVKKEVLDTIDWQLGL